MSTQAIRELNDDFRRDPCTRLGRTMVTRGVIGKGPEFINAACRAIREFEDFNRDNDPYGEHDFVSVKVVDTTIFWKVQYYDLNLEYASPNPADPTVTMRVATIMLAEEY